MRSRSSTISSVSSRASSVQSAKQDDNDPMAAFEKRIVEEFVFKLYHDGLLRNNSYIEKSIVWREFKAFNKVKENASYFVNKNVGTLLRKHNFLFHSERGCGKYCIRMKNLYAYHNAKLKEMDESHILGGALDGENNNLANTDGVIEEIFEISPDAVEFPVVFKGGFVQKIQPDFCVTFSGCYICQENFKLQSDYEEHVEWHGFESDFAFLSSPGKRCENNFEMIYRLVNKSHNFYFTMKTDKRDIIIEKIILIKANIMHYIKTNLLPYEIPSDGIDSFLIDSHLFTIGAEQPIVIVYRDKSNKTTRFVEEHHFLRTEDFPQVHFNIRSSRISSRSVLKQRFKLPEYENEVKKLKSLLKEANFSAATIANLSATFRDFVIHQKLNAANAFEVLKTLNQIEDVCSQSSYSQLTQYGAKIKRFGQEYSVKLQKLPKGVFLENILSPLDEIYLIAMEDLDMEKDINSAGRKKKPKVYRACVEGVYYNSVCFKSERPICDKKTYRVTFRPSRLGLRYQYKALNEFSTSKMLRQYLFPTVNPETSVSNRTFDLFNPLIKTNTEQLLAVQNIVDGPNACAPYIIFGPPGTGKTSTIVEAVLQLWKQRPKTRILITAGSNAACDEVAVRLCRILKKLQPGEQNILRIFSKSNDKRMDSIDEDLLECSNFYGAHFYPGLDVIREFRIIVCTLAIVGKLVVCGIGNNFFTHVFIDECAASTEPESLVAITGTFSTQTRLILAGDHKQLGPVLKSSHANDLGLKVSLMERLLNLDCYSVSSDGDYDRSIQSRLVQNFRSHSKIVNLFNTLYYGGTLRPMVKDESIDLSSDWYKMPNKEYPIVFHAAYGSNRKIGGSLSLSNEREVEIVMDYVKDLMYFGIKGRKIAQMDIGIISPYKKQYLRIQEELNRRRWFQIEVGAVETFQGKEKPIIIVSYVRSFTRTLGFLDNPRRLNVILSRAQSLLVMIGNPNTLSQNEDFKYIITECRRNKSAVGSFRDLEMQEMGIEVVDTPRAQPKDTNNNAPPCTGSANTQKSAATNSQQKNNTNQRKPPVRTRRKPSQNTNKSPIVNNLQQKNISKKADDLKIDACKVRNYLSDLHLKEKQNNVQPLNRPIFFSNEDMIDLESRLEKLTSRYSNNESKPNRETGKTNNSSHIESTSRQMSPSLPSVGKLSEDSWDPLREVPIPAVERFMSYRIEAEPPRMPAFQPLPSSNIQSASRSTTSSIARNNLPTFNNNYYDVQTRDKSYAKAVPLSSVNSKRQKDSKCVLC